jgi:hypothetical protein
LTIGQTIIRAPSGSLSGGLSTMAEYGRRCDGIMCGLSDVERERRFGCEPRPHYKSPRTPRTSVRACFSLPMIAP